MKAKILSLLFLATGVLFAQNSVLQTMINTEYAFVDRAAEVGTRDAFLAFIADDGILFRPHPLNGKNYLIESKPRPGFLTWYPSFAFLSKTGDLGFTTGPWNFKKDKNDSAEIAFGHFATIWEKQKDGSFKFAIDYGIGHEKHTQVEQSLNKGKVTLVESADEIIPGDQDNLITLEKKFSEIAKKEGIQNHLFNASQFLFNGCYPLKGIDQITEFLQQKNFNDLTYSFEGGKISKAEDLAFSYGSVSVNLKTENKNLSFYYMRVWYNQNNDWRILSETWNGK